MLLYAEKIGCLVICHFCNQLWNCLSLYITSVYPKREVGSLAAIKAMTCLIAGKLWFFNFIYGNEPSLRIRFFWQCQTDLISRTFRHYLRLNYAHSTTSFQWKLFFYYVIFSRFLTVSLWSARNWLLRSFLDSYYPYISNFIFLEFWSKSPLK